MKSRISPVKEIADPTLRKMIEAGEDMMGFTPNDAMLMAHRPEMLKSIAAWMMTTLQKGTIDPTLKRMIGYIVSNANGCQYCKAHTTFGALKYGVTPEKFEAIWNFEKSDLFSSSEKAA